MIAHQKQLEWFIESYRIDKFYELKNSKKAKKIFKETHEKYFKKYELEVYFNEVFSTGNYNCVTASATFAIIFEELGLPYEVRLLPYHAYLVLFPETDAIKIETTNPMNGFAVYDLKSKRDYVKFLKDNKIISQEEFDNNSVEDLFQMNYYKDKDCTIKELIGVQYYNYGLGQFNESKWKDAFCEFEKAYLFYHDPSVKFLMLASLNNFLFEKDELESEDLDLLVKLSNYELVKANQKNFLSNYGVYLHKELVDKGNLSGVEASYRRIDSTLIDSSLKREVGFVASIELGNYSYKFGNYEQSNDYFENALRAKPVNIDAQNAYLQTLSYKLNKMEIDESVQWVENIVIDHPELSDNRTYSEMLCNAYLIAAINSINKRKIIDSKTKLSEFENHFEQHDNINVNEQLISEAYSTIAVYYFGKGHYSTARSFVEKGLEFAPNSFELKRALSSF